MNPFEKYSVEMTNNALDLTVLEGSYLPEIFPHREREIDLMVRTLSSVFHNSRPSNLLIYGKTGTGKTSTTTYVTKMLKEKDPVGIEIFHVNCQVFDSPYSILVEIANAIPQENEDKIPGLGWPMDRIYSELLRRMNRSRRFMIVVLDEIDKIIKKNGPDSLYVILKLSDDSVMTRTSFIGITNDTGFLESLDARVRSRLNQESIMFPPYNASELRDILKFRISTISELKAIDDSALNLCAAIGAQEHGDARKALELMRIAIEVSIRDGTTKVTDKEVYRARDKFEMDVMREAVATLPLQSKIVLLSAVVTQEMDSSMMFTGEIFENYKSICHELGFAQLSNRRISDILTELEDFGLLTASTKSHGRYGRTRFIRVAGNYFDVKRYLVEDRDLEKFRGTGIGKQARIDTTVPADVLSSEKIDEKIHDIWDATPSE
ncbi:MAG: ORC1-type DNA replication protein [Thermoplasmataceae archaeon]|jgi:cell division control protein 6|nr:ORC1-type DNA replication protein [Candidatus Thermoplasmatota archaeon]